MTDRLRFGIFMAPFHPAGENPTLALQRDLELIQHLDLQGQAYSTTEAKSRAEASRPEMAAAHMKAVEAVTAKYHAEVGSKG